jgi:hypothetical protein
VEHSAQHRAEAAGERGMAVEIVTAAVGAKGGAADDEIGKHGGGFLSGFSVLADRRSNGPSPLQDVHFVRFCNAR